MPLQLFGIDHAQAIVAGSVPALKLVFNANGAIFLPVAEQHRDHKAPGISYEDNYQGNALAAMLIPPRIEVRYHTRFRDEQVANLLAGLLSHPDLLCLSEWTIVYQGRVLPPSRFRR